MGTKQLRNRGRQMKIVITRCNNCFKYYNPDVKECTNCHTDAYLMDLTKADLEWQGIRLDNDELE